MIKNNLTHKFYSIVSIIALVLFTIPFSTYAASLTSVKDTMSTQAKNTAADHTLTWTLASGHTTALNAVITVDFVQADFVASGTWQTTDFAFTDDVRSSAAPASVGTGAASCSGSSASNYIVNITAATSTFAITTCTGWTTSAATQATTFVIKGATGGTGALTNANTDTNSSVFTITNTVNDTDSGQGAAVIETNDVVTVTATVNPVLTFAISSSSVALGTLTTSAAGTGSHTLSVATNASGGFSLSYNGATLTSGSDTIDANSGSTSAPGTEEFGINLRDNATPDVGADVTQNAGTCSYTSGYGTADSYKLVASTTTTFASSSAAADCVYTASYVANISSVTAPGSYSTTLTYIASATF